MTPQRFHLRRDRRANAGFAVVAVALLMVGSAAAIYLQGVDRAAPAGEAPLVDALRTEARRSAETLSAAARALLDGALASGTGAPDLASVRLELLDGMNRFVGARFPRLGGSGLTVEANITRLAVAPAFGTAVVPSVFGGNTPEQVPLGVSVEGIAALSLALDGAPPHEEAVAFSATSTAAVLLPRELSARAGAELLPGGLAERFASQAAQHRLPDSNLSSVHYRVGPEVVGQAVRATLLWAFHSSGDAAFDARAVAGAGAAGRLTAAALYNRTRADDEPVDVGAAGQPFATEGGVPVSLRVGNYSDRDLAVSVTGRGFSGQEVGPGVWQAFTISARGHVSVSVEVGTEAGWVRAGPIRLPVAFDARAAFGPFSPELVVPPERAASLEKQARTCGPSCEVNQWLAELGLAINETSEVTAAVLQALYRFEASQMAKALPPVEDANAFMDAYGPPRRSLNAHSLSLTGPAIPEGAPVAVTVDGASAGTAPLTGGTATVARLPDGKHTVGVSAPCGPSTCAGGTVTTLSVDSGAVAVAVAPAPSGAFVGSVARRSVAQNLTFGQAALLEAEALLALPGLGTAAERLEAALARAEALLSSGTLGPSMRAAAEDAQAFLKVSMVLLKATDAARKALGLGAAPLAQAAGEAATLVLAPGTRLLLVATIHGTEIARAMFSNGSLEVSSPWAEDGTSLALDFRLEQVGLVATAALAGLTLGADVVRLQREAGENDTEGLAIAAGRLAAHTADTLRQLTQGLMRVADRFAGTMAAEAAATTFAKASVILGAVFFALDVADLYHDSGGNATLMAQNLIHPATLAGIVTLPSLAQGAASTAVGAYLLLTGQSIAVAGPIGIAVGLFVLAGVILLNGQTFASAAFGALTPEGRASFASAMGNRTRDLGRLLAFANDQDPEASAAAARALALSSGRLSVAASTTDDGHLSTLYTTLAAQSRAEATRLSARATVERALRHATLSAMEQMDDFASGNHTADAGRRTEGYGQLEKVDSHQGGWGKFPYGGDLIVQDSSALPTLTLSRGGWRGLLPLVSSHDLSRYTFGYWLTPTDGIPLSQVERFLATCAASSELIGSLLSQYRALAA